MMEVDKSIEATILDYIRFFPEEVQSDYAAMLQRCNFHDATDPCFPIMLFLLFFQENICEKVEQLDSSVQETREEIRKKQIIAASGEVKNHNGSKIFLIILTVFNLIVCAWIAYNAFAYRFPQIRQTSVKREPNQLQEMNLYWREKLETERRAATANQCWNYLAVIGIGLGSSAVFSLIIWVLLLHKIRNLEKNLLPSQKNLADTDRKKRIFQLFSQVASKPATEKQNVTDAPETDAEGQNNQTKK